MKFLFFGIISTLFLFSCNSNHKVEHVERAFYYWKGDNRLSNTEEEELSKLRVQKLYVKLFEVDYSEVRGNYPFEKNKMYSLPDSLKIIPTIFIKNDIFQYNNEKSLDVLADNIVFLIDKYSKQSYNKEEREFEYDEIQIDCDWTKSTKDKYFYLLKKIKELSKKQLSCTLRLYAYKFTGEMGVPPVDKVTLMCYNLIKPLTQKSKNSILDIDEMKKYLDTDKSYPIHLDIALPVFYWAQLYQNNQFVELLELSTTEVKEFAKETSPLWYQVEKDTSFNYGETYIKRGDQIKSEEISTQTINEAISFIKKHVKFDKETTITLFDLDEKTFKQYTNEEISLFYDSFTK